MHIYVITVCAKQINCQFLQSPSARKVWIEIVLIYYHINTLKSPSARKVWIEIMYFTSLSSNDLGHLPRGRCGLKYTGLDESLTLDGSPSARKVWIEINVVNIL